MFDWAKFDWAKFDWAKFDWATLRLTWEPRMLSILRIMTGLLFLEHGTAKIFNFPARPNQRAYELFTLSPGLAGLMEVVGGILIVLGLFTRPVAFLLSGEMAFAYFMSHAPRSFYPLLSNGDAAILYCFIFLYFFVVGAGVWSLDQTVGLAKIRRKQGLTALFCVRPVKRRAVLRAPGSGPGVVELTCDPPG